MLIIIMGICENQFKFINDNCLKKINLSGIKMLELGDQIMNIYNNNFNGIKIAKEFYTMKGINHTSFDWNGENGSIPIDLTKIDDNKKYNNMFNIITNHGTTEHVLNQYNCFKNLHNWGEINCYYIHCVPLLGKEHKEYLGYEFPPHGDYEYSSKFWEELCLQNNYELVISKGDLVSNPAISFPKNYYSASCYIKKDNNEFMNENDFYDIFNKYCINSKHRLSKKGHIEWKNSLPIDILNKYPDIYPHLK